MRRLELLDAPPQESFDRLTRLLARLLAVPVSLLHLIDHDRHFVLSHVGLGEPWASLRQVPLAQALGEHLAVHDGGGPLAVADARLEDRLAGDPALAGSGLIACAGMPLFLAGELVGALWAADEQPRSWTEDELAALSDVAALAVSELELRGALLDREQAEAALYDREQRIRLAFDEAAVGMVVVSLEPASAGRIHRVNQAFCEFLGRTEASLIGETVLDITHPDDRAITNEVIASMVRGELPMVRHLEKRYLHARGHTLWGALTTSGAITGEGNRRYVISLVENVTEHKQAELDMPAIANVLRRILSGEDARQAIVQAAVDIAGASSAHLAERTDPDRLTVTASAGLNLVGVDVRLDAPSATANAFLRGQAMFLADPAEDPLVSRELLELSHARSIMWQPIFSHEGVIGVLCVCWAERVDDVSARAARAVSLLTVETAVALAHHDALQRLAVQATTDPLTDLPNRRAWEQHLARDLAAARSVARPLTLALLDMDRFKHYNDTRGHAAGDQLLREFAARARELLREGDSSPAGAARSSRSCFPSAPRRASPRRSSIASAGRSRRGRAARSDTPAGTARRAPSSSSGVPTGRSTVPRPWAATGWRAPRPTPAWPEPGRPPGPAQSGAARRGALSRSRAGRRAGRRSRRCTEGARAGSTSPARSGGRAGRRGCPGAPPRAPFAQPASPIGAAASTSETQPTHASCAARGDLDDDRRERCQHHGGDQPVHRPRGGGHAARSRRRSRRPPPSGSSSSPVPERPARRTSGRTTGPPAGSRRRRRRTRSRSGSPASRRRAAQAGRARFGVERGERVRLRPALSATPKTAWPPSFW